MGVDIISVGFDGGGSISRFIVRRDNREPELHSFPTNLKYSDLGIAESAKGFAKLLIEILKDDALLLKAMCISLSGASDAEMNEEFKQALRKEMNLPDMKLHIEGDSSFTLETAYSGSKSGMLLIAGTGSVAIAKTKKGRFEKVGGWGRLLGDEGSGYWIGLQALKHYCKVMDGAESAGELFAAIGKKLHEENASDLSPLRSKLYRNEIKPQQYAPLVFDASAKDPAAEDILYEAAGSLMMGIEVLWTRVSGECEPVVCLHGAIARQPLIADYLEENSEALGLKCQLLEEESILHRALQVSSELSDS